MIEEKMVMICLMRVRTGKAPGKPASTHATWELGADPNRVAAPENSFDADVICACTSVPTINSHNCSPAAAADDFLALPFSADADGIEEEKRHIGGLNPHRTRSMLAI